VVAPSCSISESADAKRDIRSGIPAGLALGCGVTTPSSDALRSVVESNHGGKATFVQGVPVHEMSGGQTLWDGVVHVFDLKGSDSGAFRAYAWPCNRDAEKQEFFTILHSPRIFSPVLAVRAAIVKSGR
jgi:hypothetical protein